MRASGHKLSSSELDVAVIRAMTSRSTVVPEMQSLQTRVIALSRQAAARSIASSHCQPLR